MCITVVIVLATRYLRPARSVAAIIVLPFSGHPLNYLRGVRGTGAPVQMVIEIIGRSLT